MTTYPGRAFSPGNATQGLEASVRACVIAGMLVVLALGTAIAFLAYTTAPKETDRPTAMSEMFHLRRELGLQRELPL